MRAVGSRLARGDRVFLGFVVAALLLRALVVLLYSPTIETWADSVRYMRIAPTAFFGDPWSPAGYPAFLQVIKAITPDLTVTIAVQHFVGMLAGVFVYLAVRRADAPRWVALVPAAIVFFSGDYLFLEQILMSDTLFLTVFALAIWCAVRGSDLGPNRARWLIGCGLAIAASALVRQITLPFPILIALWLLVASPGSWRSRLKDGALVIAPAAVVIVAYVIVSTSIGPYSGLSNMSGWDLYARAAPLANCKDFTPPAGTRKLCETSAPNTRNGPFFYDWVATSPGRAAFPHDPTGAKKVGAFARAAILGEPLAYAKAVTKDLFRYVDPDVGTVRQYAGIPYALYSFGYRDQNEERVLGPLYERAGWTDAYPVHAGGLPILRTYQQIFHVGGLPVLVLALLSIAGGIFVRGRRWHLILLFGGAAFLLYLLPILTLSYDIRYGWPATPFLAASGMISAYGPYDRFGRRRTSANALPAPSPAA